MKYKKLSLCILLTAAVILSACSVKKPAAATINLGNGDEAPTLDPALTQDTTSARVIFDLFEGLTSFDQSNTTIPGLAESWDISPDGTNYTFHLRAGLKFSDGSPLTANDVVFSFQRVADPTTASPYNFLLSNIRNGQAIIEGKLPASRLAVTASDSQTIQIKLVHPDATFLAICAMPNLTIVAEKALRKYGQAWTTKAQTMVTSAAYRLSEWVVKGHMLLSKNPYYYAAKDVAVTNINILPIVDQNAEFSQYKSGQLDISYTLPVDQYRSIKQAYSNQEHTVPQEGLYYYDLSMTLPRFKNNPQLRQALSMAVDRQILVNDVLGQGQVAAYSYTTATIEDGKFAGLDYPWAKWTRAQQLATAQQLFKAAGYGPNHPLELTIQYNTLDTHKKIALAVASMWQQTFGPQSIHVTQGNQEWKTFLKARNTANYEIARDGWIADYNSVDSYTNLFQCNNPQNNSKSCNQEYDKLISAAKNTNDANLRVDLIRRALQLAMQDYAIIPLYQYTYFRLVSPRVKGYTPEDNHFDHVMSKWYKFQ